MDANLTKALQQDTEGFSEDAAQKFIDRLTEIRDYVPKIGVLGKTGAGKSSLCNALFGAELCPVSDVEACTREAKEVLLQMEQGKGMTLVDVPGVGENIRRDEEYARLYNNLLPELDLVIWVLKADDRAYSVDIECFEKMVRPYMEQGIPFFVVLNQVDKVSPFREWDCKRGIPGATQAENIRRKVTDVSSSFSLPSSRVLPVSVEEKYGLFRLVEEIIFALPNEKKVSIGGTFDDDVISPKAREVVKQSIFDEVKDAAVKLITSPAVVVQVVSKAWDIAKSFFRRWF